MNKLMNFDVNAIFGRGGRIFTISDIHGRLDSFNEFMEKVNFTTNDFAFVLGDVIDHGPDGITLLQYIRKNPDNFAMLLGNHEELFIGELAGNEFYAKNHQHNGGTPTTNAFWTLETSERNDLYNWLLNLPLVYILNGNNFNPIYLAHAGLTNDWLREVYNNAPSRNVNNLYNITWAREEWWQKSSDLNGWLITGHTNSKNFGGNGIIPCIDNDNRRIVIDMGTAKSGNLGYCYFTPDKFFVDALHTN